MKSNLSINPNTPDIETASPEYANRFVGEVGEYFLGVQRDMVQSMLSAHIEGSMSILEVGGAHGQLTPMLLESGHMVVVQCSALVGFTLLSSLRSRFPERLHLISSSLQRLPFPDRSFDAVIMMRLLSHFNDWVTLLRECCRVSRKLVILDYPPRNSFNMLVPLFFPVKKRIEGNTRPFVCFDTGKIQQEFRKNGFSNFMVDREYFVPMVVHRACNRPAASRGVEKLCRSVKMTSRFGSPAIMCAARSD